MTFQKRGGLLRLSIVWRLREDIEAVYYAFISLRIVMDFNHKFILDWENIRL